MDDQERPVDGGNLTDDELEDVNGGLVAGGFTVKCNNCGADYHFRYTACPTCGTTR